MVQDEEQQNEELLRLSTEILELTRGIHATTSAPTTPVRSARAPPPAPRSTSTRPE
jgi:hypothetical protein